MKNFDAYYDAELSQILHTPPRWIVKYGQLVMLLFFTSVVGVLLTVPVQKKMSFGIIITECFNGKPLFFCGRAIKLEKNDFAHLKKGQTGCFNYSDGNNAIFSMNFSVDSLYTTIAKEEVEYHALVTLNNSNHYLLKAGQLGDCTVAFKSPFISVF